MRRNGQPSVWAALSCAALCALAGTQGTWAAPAPFPREQQCERAQRSQLSGAWTLHWQGTTGQAILCPDGNYRCRWHGLDFVGTWKIADGRIWITESCRPTESNSWHTFSVPIVPIANGLPLSKCGLMRSP